MMDTPQKTKRTPPVGNLARRRSLASSSGSFPSKFYFKADLMAMLKKYADGLYYLNSYNCS